ncbi:MAG TPA: hypothetical protein PK095_10855 [Myxococcota bacterium]|nr:hypothetical protein [Myxococcota bacterium]
MRAFTRLLIDDTERVLHPGDLIGRNAACAFPVTDPRVSEAHAMVSLRGTSLKLIALRGRFAVDERVLTEVELVRGLKVDLAKGLTAEVLEVALPSHVLALEAPGLPMQVLSGVCSLRVGPRPELVPGFANDANALFFSDGQVWFVRLDGEDRPVVAGDSIAVSGLEVRAVAMSLAASGHAATLVHGRVDEPLVIVVRYDTVHIRQSTHPSVVLDGLLARIVSARGHRTAGRLGERRARGLARRRRPALVEAAMGYERRPAAQEAAGRRPEARPRARRRDGQLRALPRGWRPPR